MLDEADPQALIGDKAYDADALIDLLTERGVDPVIPPKANRNNQRACDYPLYCERNLIERFFNKLKHFRAIATRYDKLARNFLAGIQLACVIIPAQLKTGSNRLPWMTRSTLLRTETARAMSAVGQKRI